MQEKKLYETPTFFEHCWEKEDVITSSGDSERNFDLAKTDIFGENWGDIK